MSQLHKVWLILVSHVLPAHTLLFFSMIFVMSIEILESRCVLDQRMNEELTFLAYYT
jgi:hypothetical protein